MAQNITHVTKLNTKGQLVIPSEIRNALGLKTNDNVEIKLVGNFIAVSPVKDIITSRSYENTYSSILRDTKGTWSDNDFTYMTDKSKKEIDKAKERKNNKW